MTTFVAATDRIARFLAHIGGAALVAMMLLLIANIVLRTFSAPIQSTYELVSMAALVVTAMALGEAQVHKSHVAVDILTTRMGRRVRTATAAVVTLASVALFAELALSLADYARDMYATGSATEALGVMHWPLVGLVLVGVLGLLAALVGDLGRVARAWRSPSAEADIW
ncbi:TRAP transporter small permease [Streptomonospora litoralis]|uniref:Tripartite ATP-independent periplasmic transporter, DctQ-like component n=1 Tax=Streptomonospora litoralis TaxID=2498135 RepID=A0A4P6PZL6_9ACTN|nr:TRAP transporter small permease subunit [Streptomonospora litoralis]QBI53645.1 Tripartite ATP-independent periplasmic transporter, DctQ-like component [Streptomonospora litoralis]